MINNYKEKNEHIEIKMHKYKRKCTKNKQNVQNALKYVCVCGNIKPLN